MSRIDSAKLYERLRLDVGDKAVELLSDIVGEEQIDAICAEAGYEYRKRLFTPYVTLCALLIQALDDKKSQSNAVINLMHQLCAASLPSGSHDPSSFCAARQRLPEHIVPMLVQRTGIALEQAVPSNAHTWKRPVKLVDGTTVSMPDTPENREYFGCASNKQQTCGMPLARVTALFSLANGAALSALIDPYRVSENQQWAQLQQELHPGDIVAGDRLFGSYATLAGLRERKIDGIFQLHQTRKPPKGDWTDCIVTWKRKKKPAGMSIEDYQRLPEQMRVRLIRANQFDPDTKCRKQMIIVTTLLDKALYPAKRIVELYGCRWEVEVNFRHIKSTMKADVMSGKSPRTVKLEFHAHLLAYNLLRTVMWKAGHRHGIDPIRLSLDRARQEVLAWYRVYGTRRDACHDNLLRAVASHKIPYRPGRVEPRAVKRRRGSYPFMNQPRQVLRDQLAGSA